MAHDRRSVRVWRALARIALGVGALGLVPGAALAEPTKTRRRGKVVRVERPRVGKQTVVRMCPMPLSDDLQGTCYGGPPEVGDTAHLFDFDKKYLGKLKVTAVEPGDESRCESGSTSQFSYDLVTRASRDRKANMSLAVAVFGVDLDPTKAELIPDGSNIPSPSDEPRAQPWMAIDHDGNGMVDIVVTAFECTGQVSVSASPASGRSVQTYCLDYWRHQQNTWRKLRRDLVHTCF